MLVQSLSFKPISISPNQQLIPQSSPNPSHFVKFRTSHRENIRYLKTLRIVHPETDPRDLPPPATAARILAAVDFLKSRGFTDADFPRLAAHTPSLFTASSPAGPAAAVDSLLAFLTEEVAASADDSRRIILRCPGLLTSDVEYCLRPTLEYLRRIGLQRLNSPTNQNSHLLNTRVYKLERTVRFLRSAVGLGEEESEKFCARIPAIFGYSVEGNLQPKFEYLVWEMGRGVEELVKFPQYFGFSLEKRIAPRHVHLKKRSVVIPLNRMLMWGDQKFYAKWK